MTLYASETTLTKGRPMVVARKTTRKRTVKRATKKRPAQKRARKAAVIDAKMEAMRISHYLRALHAKKTTKGPKVNPKVLEKRIDTAKANVAMKTGIAQLSAVQHLRNLQKKAASPAMNGNFERYEKDFIAVAGPYSERNGIDYGTWRAVGVDADVLKKAGIVRTRG